MSEGKITYSFKCEGLELKALEIALGSDSVPSVTIETVDDAILKATFTTNNIYTEEKARGITDQLIERLTERLSFFLNIAVKKPIFSGSALPYETDGEIKGKHKLKVTSTIGLDAIVRAVIKPGDEKREAIISFLKNPSVTNVLLLSEFAFSLTQREHLAKFMLLYNLILQIAGDSQKSVDETIKKYDPRVIVIKTKRKISGGIKEIEETIYTKLRNEIAHKRDGVEKQDTIKKIKGNLPQFVEIVKKAVLDNKS